MKRETQNVLLVLVGGALIKITLDGSYLRYVKPVMAPLLLAAGVVIVALAVIAIARDIQASRAATEQHDDIPDDALDGTVAESSCDDEHEHSVRSAWLLLVPVLAIFLIAPPALGSDAVSRAGDRTVAAPTPDTTHRVPFPPLPPGRVISMSFSDLIARAGWDNAGTLDNRAIRVTGFVARDKAGAPFLARIVISCCAADAFPVHARLVGDNLSRYRNDQWLTVTGTITPNTATSANRYTPTLTVHTAQPIPAPAEPYEY